MTSANAYEQALRARHFLEAHLTAHGGRDEDPRSPVFAITSAIDLLDEALDHLETCATGMVSGEIPEQGVTGFDPVETPAAPPLKTGVAYRCLGCPDGPQGDGPCGNCEGRTQT